MFMFTKLKSAGKKNPLLFSLLFFSSESNGNEAKEWWVDEKRQFVLLKNGSGWVFQKCLINGCENQEPFLGREFTLRNNSREKKTQTQTTI